jgi:hypothetical protein
MPLGKVFLQNVQHLVKLIVYLALLIKNNMHEIFFVIWRWLLNV